MGLFAEIAVIDCINLILVKSRLLKQFLQSLRVVIVIVIIRNFSLHNLPIIGLIVITLNNIVAALHLLTLHLLSSIIIIL